EVLAAMGDRPERSGYDLVRAHWNVPAATGAFDRVWRRWLHDGVVAQPPVSPKTVRVAQSALTTQSAIGNQRSAIPPAALEIAFRNDPTVLDGRFANNAWLQELPKP